MRLAGLTMTVLLVACSEAADRETIVRVLPGGNDCVVFTERVPCSEVAPKLSARVALSDSITILVMTGDAVTEPQQAAVAATLKDAGFTRVAIARVGFISEPKSDS
jgi:hypothetical protein